MRMDKKLLPKPAIMNPNYISLPSEWDSSVSQLEMLQRMLYNLNQIISCIGALVDDQTDVDNKLQEYLDNMQENIETYVSEYFSMKAVWFGLTNDGYFVAYIADAWDDILFNTTGYDINVPLQPEYGHLVLSFEVFNN